MTPSKWSPEQPYDALPPLPPAVDLESKVVLKQCIAARTALAELKGAAELLPNQGMLINTLPLLEAKKIGAVFAYGNFLTVALNFVILAFIIFLMIKQINRLKKEAPAAAPAATPEDVVLLREIRDSLKK